jgi:hypothetical protein
MYHPADRSFKYSGRAQQIALDACRRGVDAIVEY